MLRLVLFIPYMISGTVVVLAWASWLTERLYSHRWGYTSLALSFAASTWAYAHFAFAPHTSFGWFCASSVGYGTFLILGLAYMLSTALYALLQESEIAYSELTARQQDAVRAGASAVFRHASLAAKEWLKGRGAKRTAAMLTEIERAVRMK